MKKIGLRLDADDLRVVSFDTGAAGSAPRTVEAYGARKTDDTPVLETHSRTCEPSVDDTRRYTCVPSLGDTACTYDHTCEPTACAITCDPYCAAGAE